jgi:hypothetical protein
MSYTFGQVINKLTAGKPVTRPGWSSGKYIVSPLNVDGVLMVYPNNASSPAQLYYPTLSDMNATDWIDAS